MDYKVTVLDIIKKRRSIRRFLKKPIPQEIIDAMIDAAIWAPSAGNLQARKFYFVFNQEIKERIVKVSLGQTFIAEAPLAIVCCADLRIKRDYGNRGTDLYTLQDVAASIQNIMLVSCEYGLGSVWVGAFDEDKVCQVLNLPPYLRPVSIIPVGYPGETPPIPERIKKQDAVVTIASQDLYQTSTI